jgi:glutaconyl-CoA decarboxylase
MKYVITLNGKDYEVEVNQGGAQVLSVSDAKAAPAPQAAPAAAPAPKPAAAPAPAPAPSPAPAGGESVSSPMPGTIIKVLVSQGQAVKRGDVLCVLEAMKMENEIQAPVGGTVAHVGVSQGASVNSGDVLFTIK